MSSRRFKPGGTASRGYGREHQLLRAKLLRRVVWGVTPCARCGSPLTGGPRIQVITVDALLRGARPKTPLLLLPYIQASRATPKAHVQGSLLDDA
jgi:hypothetical protein